MSGTVIVAGARTPIGRLLGGLKSFSAADLGGIAIKGALEKAGVTGEQVDYLIMGQVILAGAGQPEEGQDHVEVRAATVSGNVSLLQV
jgi:acetyl-CoA C-acetyltransferase